MNLSQACAIWMPSKRDVKRTDLRALDDRDGANATRLVEFQPYWLKALPIAVMNVSFFSEIIGM